MARKRREYSALERRELWERWRRGESIGEFLGGGQGMGSLIRISASRLAIDRVFAYVAILSILGYLLYLVTGWVERRVVFWRATTSAPQPGM